MRTDLTEKEHKLLHLLWNNGLKGSMCWIRRDEDEDTNSSLTSLIERGLVARKDNGWFIYITEDGEFLIRFYGKP
jgi:hypothetical protein